MWSVKVRRAARMNSEANTFPVRIPNRILFSTHFIFFLFPFSVHHFPPIFGLFHFSSMLLQYLTHLITFCLIFVPFSFRFYLIFIST